MVKTCDWRDCSAPIYRKHIHPATLYEQDVCLTHWAFLRHTDVLDTHTRQLSEHKDLLAALVEGQKALVEGQNRQNLILERHSQQLDRHEQLLDQLTNQQIRLNERFDRLIDVLEPVLVQAHSH